MRKFLIFIISIPILAAAGVVVALGAMTADDWEHLT